MDMFVFLKNPEIYTRIKYSIFKKWYQPHWISANRRVRTNKCISTWTKGKSKWTEDLNKKLDTLNPIEEKGGSCL